MASLNLRRSLRVFLLAVVVVQLVSTAALAAGGGFQAATTTTDDGTATQNNTTYQENPENVSESGDLQAVQSWLSGGLSERLRGSSVNLTQGQYDRARTLLGDDYDATLSKYVDVAGETDTQRDDRAGDLFGEARNDQRDLTDALQKYDQTRRAYQQAKERGDTARTRELAREMDTLATTIRERSTTLSTTSRALENATGITDPVGAASIADLAAAVTAETAAVREETFVETDLVVTSVSAQASLVSPVVVEGHVETANGSRLVNRTVQISVANRTYRPTLGANGSFRVSHRPIDMEAGPQEIAIEYRPAAQSPYLGSNVTRTVTIRAIDPDLSIGADAETVRYGDSITITGTVSSQGQRVAAVPLSVRGLDGATQSVQSDANGSYRASVTVPATVPPGEQEVVVATRNDSAPVTYQDATTTVTVAETVTNLTLAAESSSESVTVSGTFETAGGTPIASQSLSVSVDGEAVTSARTDGAGDYLVSVPRSEFGAGTNHTVAVAYDAPNSNLESANASATVRLTGGGPSSSGGGVLAQVTVSRPVLGGVVIVVLAGAGLALWFVRGTEDEGEVVGEGAAEPTEESTPEPTGSTFPSEAVVSAFEDAEATAGVVQSYERLRGALVAELDVADSPATTHREFATNVASVLGESSAFQTLTDTYERAKFGGVSLADSDAATYREALDDVLDAVGSHSDSEERPAMTEDD